MKNKNKMYTYRKMVCRLASTVHCHKHVVMGLTVQSHVHMCMMLLCHFPLNHLKIQRGCVQVNLESYTIELQNVEIEWKKERMKERKKESRKKER